MIFAIAVICILILLIIVLSFLFGPGHEEAESRKFHPKSELEIELGKEFRNESGYLSRPRGAKIFTQQWYPQSTGTKGIVVIVHGLNDHGGRQLMLVKHLLQHNFIVALIDFEGFGRSSGRHGFFPDFNALVVDLRDYITQLNRKDLPLFLLGGSMGGLLILHTVLSELTDRKIQGAVIQAPAILIHSDTRPHDWIEKISKLIVYYFPKIPLVQGNRGKNSSAQVSARNEAEKAADFLFYSGRLRIGTGLAILGALEQVADQFDQFNVPYLLQHGTADRVCHVSGSEKFHKATKSKDKTFVTYENAHHDLMHEPQEVVDRIIQDLTSWLLDRSLKFSTR